LDRDIEQQFESLQWQLDRLAVRLNRLEHLLHVPASNVESRPLAPPPIPEGTSVLPLTPVSPAAPPPPVPEVSQNAAPPIPQPATVEASPDQVSGGKHLPLFPAPAVVSAESHSGAASPSNSVPKLEPLKAAAGRQPAASLESRIGGQWLNRLGVVAVLVGLSYFLKLAIENNWIGPAARILIGLAAGIALMVWSERFRKHGFAGFAYSLKALGIGALYLSLWAAFQIYHLVPAMLAFAGMVMVTLTAAALSLAQGSELLAALALLGGFLTPVLLASNRNQEVSLFAYLLLLDLGAMWIVAAKGWKRLLPEAFAGTWLLFAAWADAYYSDAQLTVTLVFASIFFLMFAVTPLLRGNVSPLPDSGHAFVPALLVLNAVVYFATLFMMMEPGHRQLLAWLTFAVAGFYFLISRSLLRRLGSVAIWEPLHVALAIVFLTIGVPLKFDGAWITFAWNIEAAAMILIAHRTGRRLLLRFGTGITALAVIRLLLADSGEQHSLIINPRFGLFLLTIAVISLLTYTSLQYTDGESRRLAGAAVISINLLALIALSLEVQDYFFDQLQTRAAYPGDDWRSIRTVEGFTLSALWMTYGAALMVVGFWKREAFLRWQAIVLLAITAIKVFFFDIATLQRGYRIAAFIVLGVILLAVSFFYQRMRVSTAEP
jgi:uncharacterized membrane protein